MIVHNNPFSWSHIVATVFGAVVISVLGSMILYSIFDPLLPQDSFTAGVVFTLGGLIGLLIGTLSPNASEAWRRTLLTSAVLSFLLPVVTVISQADNLFFQFFLFQRVLVVGLLLGFIFFGLALLVGRSADGKR